MPNTFKPTLSEEERAAARTLFLALKPFRDVNPSMSLSYITAKGKALIHHVLNAIKR